jgi:hypothetical protein
MVSHPSRKNKNKTRVGHGEKFKASAGPSTAQATKSVACFAQDDSLTLTYVAKS